MSLVRFGVSLPKDLIERFDAYIHRKKYTNRSEAIRDLIRRAMIEEEVTTNKNVIGVLHIIYDHHQRDLSDKLNDIQHDQHDLIISTTHVHLDHNNCLEVTLLKGNVETIRSLSERIIATKGVKNGKLYLTSCLK